MSRASRLRFTTVRPGLPVLLLLIAGFLIGDMPLAMAVRVTPLRPQTLGYPSSDNLTTSTLSFVEPVSTVDEGDGQATLMLRRTGDSAGRATARVDITGGTAGASDYLFTPGALDSSFQGGADGAIAAIAVQPDGKIMIGGYFSMVNGSARSRIARLNPDGTLDNPFNAGSITGGMAVYTIAVQPDGKILIGGDFSAIDGTPLTGLARLNPDGSLDTDFLSSVPPFSNGPVRSLVVQSDGKILVGGFFNMNMEVRSIVQLNADGSPDSSFDCDVNGSLFTVAQQDDGRIVISGIFSAVDGTPRQGIARLNQDCSLDPTFDPGDGINGTPYRMVIQDDGKILVGGSGFLYNGIARPGIARVNVDGSLDLSFDPQMSNGSWLCCGVDALTVQPNGKILIGGSFTAVGGIARNGIARLHSDGSLDTLFDPGTGSLSIYAFGFQDDGRILVGGGFSSFNGTSRANIARLHGDLFATWEDGETADQPVVLPIVDDALAEGDETITFSLTPTRGGAGAGQLSAHTLTIIDDDNTAPTIAPVDAISTGEDTPTSPIALTIGDAHTLPEQLTVTASSSNQTLVPDSQIALSGSGANRSMQITPAANQHGEATITLTVSDGSRTATTSFVLEVTPVNDLPSFTGGANQTAVCGVGQQTIAGWASAISPGAPDEAQQTLSFVVTANDNPGVFLAQPAVDPATGNLTFTPSAQQTGVARLMLVLQDSEGASSTAYQLTITIETLDVLSFASSGTTVNEGDGLATLMLRRTGDSAGRVTARVDITGGTAGAQDIVFEPGALDSSFQGGTDGAIAAIAIQPDGKILIGGYFTMANNSTRSRIARLNPDGSLDNTFNTGSMTGGMAAYTIAVQPDGKILIGGDFSAILTFSTCCPLYLLAQ
jgi:uncharacterized delta-60 repeat protein